MARLNTRTSATPIIGRSSTADSLYRDPTPADQTRGGSTARQSSYSVLSPVLSHSSDKENDVPESRGPTPPPRTKGKAMAGPRVHRLPTPDSGCASSSHPNKRRRTNHNYSRPVSGLQGDGDHVHVHQDADDDEVAQEEGQTELGLATPEDEEEDESSRYYNPDQDPEERRQLRAGLRNFQRNLDDNRDEFTKPGNRLLEDAIPQSTHLLSKVRNTAEAVLDSHAMLTMSAMSAKRLKASVEQGDHGIGIDLDQFVSRCIFFMKEHHPPGADEDAAQTPSRGTRQTQDVEDDEDDEEDDSGEGLDWAFLGRNACFATNKRPPLSSFLLGPLSLQRRVRVQTRRARSQRQPLGAATRPQELRPEDIQRNENADVMNLVHKIRRRLMTHCDEASAKVEEEMGVCSTEEEANSLYGVATRRHRVYQTLEGEAAVSLFDFVVNPTSFSQTVENLFYISFMIREGAASVVPDKDGLPLLAPVETHTAQQQAQRVVKRQAIFSIDYATWQALIEAFDIQEPLIPHRVDEQMKVTPGGWYG